MIGVYENDFKYSLLCKYIPTYNFFLQNWVVYMYPIWFRQQCCSIVMVCARMHVLCRYRDLEPKHVTWGPWPSVRKIRTCDATQIRRIDPTTNDVRRTHTNSTYTRTVFCFHGSSSFSEEYTMDMSMLCVNHCRVPLFLLIYHTSFVHIYSFHFFLLIYLYNIQKVAYKLRSAVTILVSHSGKQNYKKVFGIYSRLFLLTFIYKKRILFLKKWERI